MPKYEQLVLIHDRIANFSIIMFWGQTILRIDRKDLESKTTTISIASASYYMLRIFGLPIAPNTPVARLTIIGNNS